MAIVLGFSLKFRHICAIPHSATYGARLARHPIKKEARQSLAILSLQVPACFCASIFFSPLPLHQDSLRHRIYPHPLGDRNSDHDLRPWFQTMVEPLLKGLFPIKERERDWTRLENSLTSYRIGFGPPARNRKTIGFGLPQKIG